VAVGHVLPPSLDAGRLPSAGRAGMTRVKSVRLRRLSAASTFLDNCTTAAYLRKRKQYPCDVVLLARNGSTRTYQDYEGNKL